MTPTFNPFDFAAPASPRRKSTQRSVEKQKQQHEQPRRSAAPKPPEVKRGGRLDALASMLSELRHVMAGRVAQS